MRLEKRDLTRRVNGDLAIQFGDEWSSPDLMDTQKGWG